MAYPIDWWAGVEGDEVPKLTNKELAERMALHVSSRRSSGLNATKNGAWDMMLEAAKRLVDIPDQA
jgi:hypothetical protein